MKSYRTERHVHVETESRIIDFKIGDRVEWSEEVCRLHQGVCRRRSEGVELKGTIMQFNALGEGEILAIIQPDVAGVYGMARPLSILSRVKGLEGARLGEWVEH